MTAVHITNVIAECRYFQEYKPSHHKQIQRVDWCIGSHEGCEYDVPQCAPGTPASECTHEISGVVTPPGKSMHFVGAHYHCHAPTCVRMEIYNNVTGELLCREEPYHGQGADTKGMTKGESACECLIILWFWQN